MAKIQTPAMEKYEKKNRKAKKYSPSREAWRRLCRNRTAVLGLIIIIVLLVVAILADVIAPYEFQKQMITDAYQTPSFKHLFGTDNFGRDLFSRCVYGTRYTLSLGLLCVLASLGTGGALGMVAGYAGGRIDNYIMRFMDILQAIPQVLLAICIASALGNGVWQLIAAMTISNLPVMTRNFRTAILNVRTAEYIESSQAIGVSKVQMVLRHMLPNAVGVIVIYVVQVMANSISTIASLSYLGVGLQPPAAEWGLILSDCKGFFTSFPHMVLFPALLIMITVLAMNMLGDGLRDAFDPRLK
ncbi:MAG: ABC transporter permease [Ruthenibacterium sp.]